MYQSRPHKAAENADEKAATLLKIVEDLAAEMHPNRTDAPPATLDASLDRDIGLDSLARVELLARIERHFNVTIPESVFAEAETPRDLMRALTGAGTKGSTLQTQEPKVARVQLGEAEAAPHGARTLLEVLKWHVEDHPDRPHIEFYQDGGRGAQMTYHQLHEGAERLAAGLQHLGLHAREPVAIMLPTGPDYFLTFFGILFAGAIPVPIYPPVRKSQIEDHLKRHQAILNNCGAVSLVTVPDAKPLARLLRSHVQTLHSVVTADELRTSDHPYQTPVVGAQDLAFLQYTSGSTGNPKGVALTHANLLANIRAIGDSVKLDDTDVAVSWLPLYHDMGLIGAWFCSMYYAMLLVIMSPLDFLTRPQRWLWAIHRYRGTVSAAPNFAYELCLKRVSDQDLKGLDLSSWRITCDGAEPVSPETIDRFCARFAEYGFRRETLMPVYGLAECSVALAFPPLGRPPVIDAIQREPFVRSGRGIPSDENDPNPLRFVACGRPLPGHEIRIVDAAGHELPERHEGGLQFRGPSTTSGYYRNPEATRQLLHGDWLDSGDLAYVAGGDVYITGRRKDVIIRAGRNIYPHELEEAVGNVNGIRKGNVAVFGSSDPQSGTERLIVLAETREKDAAALDRLRVEINSLATDLIGTPPEDVVLAPPGTVPKTSSGKIRRAAGRELYERGQIGKGSHAVWWQITRLAAASILPELRRSWRVVTSALYAGYAFAWFGVLAFFTWIPVVVLPRDGWRWAIFRRMSLLLVRVTGMPLTVRGLENVPRTRPCVIVANHASYIDSYVLPAVLPVQFSFVAKGELGDNRLTRIFLERLRVELVERFDKQRGIEDARRIGRTGKAGRSLLFYPEGGTSRMPGLKTFFMGAFVVAEEVGAPIVPVAVRGTRSAFRTGSWFPRRNALSVVIGSPIEPASYAAEKPDPWATALKLRDASRSFILQHCGEPDLGADKPRD